jgi:F0F1-type ATP synthase assembly protein I
MPESSCCSSSIFSRQAKTKVVLVMFSLLIVFDIIGLLDSLLSLTSSWLETGPSSYLDESGSQEDQLKHTALFFGEIFCFLILLLCNSLGISGVQKKTPYLIVPWLGVYMVGILSCYIASFILFLSQFYDDDLTIAPLVPVITGLVFHTGWTFVNSVFNDLRTELRRRSVTFGSFNDFKYFFKEGTIDIDKKSYVFFSLQFQTRVGDGSCMRKLSEDMAVHVQFSSD